MATFNSFVSSAEKPAKIALGVVVGRGAQKMVNKAIDKIGTDDKKGEGMGLLGADTTSTFKKYISPLIVAGVGIYAASSCESDFLRKVGQGMAVSGIANVGIMLINECGGGNLLGDLIGDDDLEGTDELEGDDDLEGFEEYETTPIAALPQFDAPLAPAITRDAPWEKETISGFSSIL